MNDNNQHIPAGYKPSPLGLIPEDWEVKKLGDLCENKGDYGLNAPATDYSVNLPTYLRITDIDDNGNFIHSAKKSVDNLSAKEYYLKDGDIVFARTGATVGKTYLYDVRDGQLVYAGFLIKFSPNPNKLIPYYLKAHTETKDYTNWVAITSQRSGQPGINAAEYCSLKLALPPIKEQERICNVLQLWDTAIAKQTALIEQLTLRKHGLMQQLLTAKKRLKGFEGEWKEVRLGEIGKFVGGCAFNEQEQGGQTGIPFYKVSDMNLSGNESKMTIANNYVTHEQIERLGYIVIEDEAIIFAKVGAAIALERKRYAKNFIIDNNMLAYIPSNNVWFMKYWFDSISLSKYIQVGALPSYNASDFSSISNEFIFFLR